MKRQRKSTKELKLENKKKRNDEKNIIKKERKKENIKMIKRNGSKTLTADYTFVPEYFLSSTSIRFRTSKMMK